MSIKQKRTLRFISTNENDVQLKKQKVGKSSPNVSCHHLEYLSHDISKLCSKLETNNLQDFKENFQKLWKLLIPLRLKKKLGMNYCEETCFKTREKAEEKWLAESFMIIYEILLRTLEKDIQGFAVFSLKYLMKCLKIECQIRFMKQTDHSTFPLRLLQSILKCCILCHTTYFTNLCNSLIENYFNRYKDLQFYSLQALENLIIELLEKNHLKKIKTQNDQDIKMISQHIFILLHSFPNPKEMEKQQETYGLQLFCLKYLSSHKSICKIEYQNAFVSCWMRYLRLNHATIQLSLNQYKEVLCLLPTHLLPFLKCPLVISHIFFQAFYHNDLQIAVEALSGLFYLIVKSRLGEPQLLDATAKEFYTHLLSLVQPSIFSLNITTRFIRLLEASLRSKLLSSTMKASFIKRLVCVSLLTPPGAALWLLSLALSLLQLSGCGIMKFLILRNLTENCFEEEDPLIQFNESCSEEDNLILNDSIPFNKRMWAWTTFQDNLKSDEETRETLLHIYSLWELNYLKLHWDPSIRHLVNLFDEDIFSIKATRIDTQPFLKANNCEIFFRYMKPFMKEQEDFVSQYAPVDIQKISDTPDENACLPLLRLGSLYERAC